MEKNMKSFNKLSTAILVVVGFTTQTANAVNISLGHPNYGGNGCPIGTVSTTLSHDKKSLSVLFDDFIVEANRHHRTARKSCNVAIPVRVPNGFSVSVFKVDHRGFASIPTHRDYVRLRAEYFFAGRRGPRFSKYINRQGDHDFFYKNNIVGIADVWSRCGRNVILRANTNVLAKSRSGRDVIGSIDTQDINANMVFHIRYRRCRR
jgi:hypothetical protein